jgi:hypothetical protein
MERVRIVLTQRFSRVAGAPGEVFASITGTKPFKVGPEAAKERAFSAGFEDQDPGARKA